MNPFAAALGGAVIGGANKYQQIQDEQRKFKIDEGKRNAEHARKENFASLNYSRQDSGMVNTETGAPLTHGEASALDPGSQQAGWKAKEDYVAEKKGEQDLINQDKLQAAAKTKEAKRVEVRDEKREYAESLADAKEKTRLAKEESKSVAKTKADKEKLLKEFRGRIGSELRDAGTPSERTEGTLSVLYDIYGNDAVIKAQPQVKKARFIDEQAQSIAEMQNGGSGKAEVISMMKEEGMKPKDITEAIEYAMYKGWFIGATGPDKVFGYKGKGW